MIHRPHDANAASRFQANKTCYANLKKFKNPFKENDIIKVNVTLKNFKGFTFFSPSGQEVRTLFNYTQKHEIAEN